MEKNKINRIFILLLFIATFTSCKKETLTSATQVGANTFSCRVNGAILIPNREAFGSEAISLSLRENDENSSFSDITILTNYSKNKPNSKVNIILYKVNVVGKYLLNRGLTRYGEYISVVPNGLGGITYDSSGINNGEVNITKFDTENRILSGIFWFEATNKNDPNDKVSITDGRFDLKF